MAASALLDHTAEPQIEDGEPLVKREPDAGYVGVEATTCSVPVIARIPPSLGGPTNPCYMKAPANFFTGFYFETSSSIPAIYQVQNIMLNATLNANTGVQVDISSFQVPGCAHIYTSYSTNTYNSAPVDTFPDTLSGQVHLLECLAYGTDGAGHPYFVQWGPVPTLGLIILSASRQGPDSTTYNQIISALNGLGNSNVNAQVQAMKPVVQNTARNFATPVVCGSECMANKNSYNGTCASP